MNQKNITITLQSRDLIDEIYGNANSRRAKDKAETEKRRAENERIAEYKKQRAEESKAEREAKLKKMYCHD
jgi:hypothetical protein